jgi:DNA-binding transcriptional MerR regulator
MDKFLPLIPAKRYFSIGEVGELCGVKPHVLRYWEQEFTQLRPIKRRGNRRYYQHHEVLMIRRIRELLYDQGFTISGARNKIQEILASERDKKNSEIAFVAQIEEDYLNSSDCETTKISNWNVVFQNEPELLNHLRIELFEIRDMLQLSVSQETKY